MKYVVAYVVACLLLLSSVVVFVDGRDCDLWQERYSGAVRQLHDMGYSDTTAESNIFIWSQAGQRPEGCAFP